MREGGREERERERVENGRERLGEGGGGGGGRGGGGEAGLNIFLPLTGHFPPSHWAGGQPALERSPIDDLGMNERRASSYHYYINMILYDMI